MAAHAGTSSSTPVLRPIRIRRPRPRLVLAVVLLALAASVASAPGEVAAAWHATCTVGTPSGTSCGEALVLLGYP